MSATTRGPQYFCTVSLLLVLDHFMNCVWILTIEITMVLTNVVVDMENNSFPDVCDCRGDRISEKD